MSKKWGVVLGYITAILFIIIYKEPILHWLKEDSLNNIPLMVGASILLALVPVVPFGVIAGIMGAKYGIFLGGLLNVLIATIAAIVLFLSVRMAFRDQGRRFLEKFKRMDQFTILMERNAFLAVLTARLIPFVPAPAVNVYAAISQMKFGSYAAATLIGKIPVMFVFAVIGEQILTSMSNVIWTTAIYVLFLLTVVLIHRFFIKQANNKFKSTKGI